MGLIGHEIIQSRVWVDPTNPPPPNLNYKFTFPLTVFDAVRRDMEDENSETLTQVLEKISQEINSKQNLIPAKPANYLVTYAGTAGAVGSIQISKDIPWESEKQSNNKIPTEKAVGDLIRKLGIDPDNPDSGAPVRWSNIIGRPTIYDVLGDDVNGIINQKAITDYLTNLTEKLDNNISVHEELSKYHDVLESKFNIHIDNKNNPHNVTISQIGAASAESLEYHINEDNPHNITPDIIGLGNVDNTRDIDKPISLATQEALDSINDLINTINGNIESSVVDIEYDQINSTIELIYSNGSTGSIPIPVGRSINSISYDSLNKKLITINNAGVENKIDISELFIRYLGSTGSDITIKIDGNQNSGNQIIRASINNKGINESHIANNAITNRTILDESITANKIKDKAIGNSKYANRSITSDKIDKYGLTNDVFANRSINGRVLFSSPNNYQVLATINAGSDAVWTYITSHMIANSAITNAHIANKSITGDKIDDNTINTDNIKNLSVTAEKIKDESITDSKLADGAVTSRSLAPDLTFEGNTKIKNEPSIDSNGNEVVSSHWVRTFIDAGLQINTHNITDRAVNGTKLFSSSVKDKVLAVLNSNQDPEWSSINNNMMEDNSISTRNLIDKSVTADKIASKSIENRHLDNNAIQQRHIEESAVTSDKIYKSHEGNRVLAALSDESHPVYTQVTNEMIAPNAIGSKQIMDGSISPSKIESSSKGQQVIAIGLGNSAPIWSKVTTQMINDRAIDGNKLFTSERDNVILGITNSYTNPIWTKVTGNMIANNTITGNNIAQHSIVSDNIKPGAVDSNAIKENAIQSKHIEYGAIKPESIETSPIPGRILAVTDQPYSTPKWTQVDTSMIKDEAVTGDKIFKSDTAYKVLGATQPDASPEYLKLTHHFIVDGTITPQKLQRNFSLLGSPELTVQPDEDANDMRLANTKWVRETILQMAKYFNGNYPGSGTDEGELFGDIDANTIDKIIDSNFDEIPNYVSDSDSDIVNVNFGDCVVSRISNKDIADDVENAFSNNHTEIPDSELFDTIEHGDYTINTIDNTSISDIINNRFINGIEYIPNTNTPNNNSVPSWWPAGSFSIDDIPSHSIYGDKLFTSSIAPRVLGIKSPNENVDFILINDALIENGAITRDKIQRSIELLGSPTIEVRPSANACDASGNGNAIPDCQWVIDRIIDALNDVDLNGTGSTADTILSVGSVTTNHIQDRAITADKLFTSTHNNRLLGVINANSDPIYLQANNEMIADRAVDGRTLFSSNEPEKVLAVTDANSDPTWTRVTSGMVSDKAINKKHIANNAIGNDQIDNNAITARTLANEPLINEDQLMDNTVSEYKLQNNSVNTAKIVDSAITTEKIQDKAITGDKLDDNIILPENASIQSSADYEQRLIRNIIISPNSPNNSGHNGDIWFKFS